MLQFGFVGAQIAVLLNLQDDFEISVDFFCDPCARTSKRFMTVTVPDPMPRGAFKIEVRHVSEVSHAKKHHDGEDVLEEEGVSEPAASMAHA